MTNSRGFEDRVARLQASTDRKANEEAGQEAQRLSQWDNAASDLESAIHDLVSYLEKRTPAKRIRVREGDGILKKGRLSSPPGWILERRGGNVDVLLPDGKVWSRFISSYAPKDGEIRDLINDFRKGRSVRVGSFTFEVKDSEIVASKFEGHDVVTVRYLDAFAEIAQKSHKIAVSGV